MAVTATANSSAIHVLSPDKLSSITSVLTMKPKMNGIVTVPEGCQLLKRISNILAKNTNPEKLSPTLCKEVMLLIPGMIILDYEGVIDVLFHDVVFDQCQKDSLLKTFNKEIPRVVFPNGQDVSLIDLRPNAKGPDDEMYEKHEVLRKMIPRGLSILTIKVNGKTTVDTCIYGSKKFAGLTIEDDDDHLTSDSKKYFSLSPDMATQIVAMEKVNGEAAHFSGRFIDGRFYFIAGSKNVHLIFQEEEHIELYTEDRYAIAKEIALTLFRKWLTLSKMTREFLQKFLHITRATIVCEIMIPSHQHVVYFDGLKENKLVVLAVSRPPPSVSTGNQNLSFTALSAHHSLLLFSALGFDVPEFKVLDIEDLPEHQSNVRERTCSEGVVYYFIDQQGDTIGLMKLKTKWYIHLRALRQQASYRHKISTKFRRTKSLEDSSKRSRSRMKELQLWLHTTEEELEAWGIMSDAWFNWLEEKVSHDSFPTPKDVRDNFPCVWKPFIASLQNATSPSEDILAAVTLLKLACAC